MNELAGFFIGAVSLVSALVVVLTLAMPPLGSVKGPAYWCFFWLCVAVLSLAFFEVLRWSWVLLVWLVAP